MNWKIWLKGLISAAIGGAANAGLVAIIAPEQFNFQEGLSRLGTMAIGGAIIAILSYLKQSPLPNGGKT